jgi:hypothetical protein
METSCTFSVDEFVPGEWEPEIRTALGTGNARMVKSFEGGLTGRSVTQFSFCFDNDTGVGSYVATESYDGTVDGHRGTFNFIHSATTLGGGERLHDLFVIVPRSGTGELAGISGTGALVIDDDGTHRITLDYELG